MTDTTQSRGGAAGGDHEGVADTRVRDLLDRYVAQSGAILSELRPGLYQLEIPAPDRAAFGRRSVVRLAFSLEALEDDPRAEMAIVGGVFVGQLIDAVRLRGTRLFAGRIGSGNRELGMPPSLPVSVRDGRAAQPAISLARHRVGRLNARIVIRAGSALEEHLAESDLFDLCSGLPLGSDIVAECESILGRPRDVQLATDAMSNGSEVPCRPMADLVNSMLSSLERRIRPRVDAIAESAARELAHELGRIDRYYTSLLDDAGGRTSDLPDAESRAAFQSEHARRAKEERDRHSVRAAVHPVQLVEWEIAAERAEWAVANTRGRHGTFAAQRFLAGERRWTLACPECGSVRLSELAICRHDHVGCASCTHECSVCAESFCAKHGSVACHVDGAPSCDEHTRRCRSCRRVHCSAHEGVCEESGHQACTSCLAPCAHCARLVCTRHTTLTNPNAPLGARRLCGNCVRKCEGGAGEIVGPDEVAGCASCERVVCTNHQARCAVDGKIHCSTHLRRTDRSRRLVCEHDRATCALEPNAVLAADEVGLCSTCSILVCNTHSGTCVIDRQRHCLTHLHSVGDRPGELACDVHVSICHVDNSEFTLDGTRPCPSCGRLTCASHLRRCVNCARGVCTSDFRPGARTCATCSRLQPTQEPSDSAVSAVVELRGADAGRPREWKTARDARHIIIEIDLGWTRRMVLAIPHGDARAEVAISHSMLGSRVIRG